MMSYVLESEAVHSTIRHILLFCCFRCVTAFCCYNVDGQFFPFMFVALLQQKLLICPVWVYLQNYGILAILGYLRYYYIHLYSS